MNFCRTWAFVLLTAIGGCSSVQAARVTAREHAAEPMQIQHSETILATGSYWRVFAMCGDAVVPVELLRESNPAASAPRTFGSWQQLETSPPPVDWTKVDFDDSTWFRATGPVSGRMQGWGSSRGIRALLCIRGKFVVKDPRRVKRLTLSLGYRGGVVVYLNGTEVARAGMPSGAVSPVTPALPYSRETYLDSKGRLIPSHPFQLERRINAGEAYLADSVARRERSVGPAALPVSALRKGVNILAIEVHRAAFRPEALKWTGKENKRGWSHIELRSLHLSAQSVGDAIMPNVSRRKGFQVWNQDIHGVFSVAEYGDPNEPLLPIRMVGARNGYYSGQVVVASTSSIVGLQAKVTDLKGVGGAVIKASNVRVRYANLSKLGISANFPGLGNPTGVPAFLELQDAASARIEPNALRTDEAERTKLGLAAEMSPAAVQPIWVTLRVPKETPAGSYRGALLLSASALPKVEVPIKLEVIDWTLPDVQDYQTFIGIYQSPESVALQYGVPMWSEKHWALLEKSFKLLGYLGNKLLIIPLVCKTQFGNEESMIPWTRQPDDSYKYDFTVHDRYLALASKYCNLKVISYQIWTPYGGGYHKTHRRLDKPTFVTVVDPATGKREPMRLPPFGGEESKRLWKSLLDAIQARLKKVELENTMTLGIQSDAGCPLEVTEQFKAIIPEAGWHRGAHGRSQPTFNRGIPQTYREYLYVPNVIDPPTRKRNYGWAGKHLVVMSQRLYDPWQWPKAMRTMPERALVIGDRGAGRMCLDYWPVEGSTQEGSLFNRWPDSSSCQRRPFLRWLALPGKEGASSTIKIEALHEGLQEAEARIFLERALVNKDKDISGTLADRCQILLDRRTDFCRIVHSCAGYGITELIRVTYGKGWQQRSLELYTLAAEVAHKGN